MNSRFYIYDNGDSYLTALEIIYDIRRDKNTNILILLKNFRDGTNLYKDIRIALTLAGVRDINESRKSDEWRMGKDDWSITVLPMGHVERLCGLRFNSIVIEEECSSELRDAVVQMTSANLPTFFKELK